MVAKHYNPPYSIKRCLNLAKIHMVAKPMKIDSPITFGLNLAKIHMVAKLVTSVT